MPRRNGGQQSNNLYGELMSATARGDEKALERLIPRAKAEGTLNENLLRLGLQNACKKGKVAAAHTLLLEGAPTDLTGDKGSPALFWAVTQPQTKGHEEVIKMLLSSDYKGCPADPERRDEDGRTIFMAAAWRGHNTALRLLLDYGAKYNSRDNHGRTILHNLAVDKKCRWDAETINIILDRDIDVDCKDNRSRTALHWAVATFKPNLVGQLVTRKKFKTPDINAVEKRGKTALHLACRATPAIPSIVEMLLEHGADVSLASDGQWTCLHNTAKKQDQMDIVHMILEREPSLVNARTSTGMTPLHVASQFGNACVVSRLLESPDIKLNVKDAFYMTPMLRAAQEGHTQIVEMLAPFNEVNLSKIPPVARETCDRFEATIVDFRADKDLPPLVSKRTIDEVLYGKEKDGSPVINTNVHNMKRKAKNRPRFRWIHLPANNMAWAEALITKAFVESGGSDVKGLKSAERAFSQQHRGEQYHSSFMKPYCERSPRGTHERGNRPGSSVDAPSRISVVEAAALHAESSPERAGAVERRRQKAEALRASSGAQEALPRISGSPAGTHSPIPEVKTLESEPRRSGSDGPSDSRAAAHGTPPDRQKTNSPRPSRRARRQRTASGLGIENIAPPPQASEDQNFNRPPRTFSMPLSEVSARSTDSHGNSFSLSGSNISFFMPYLHFETDHARREMSAAIRSSAPKHSHDIKRLRKPAHSQVRDPWSRDEMLIHAYLHSTTGLHLRRTLDQFGLQGIDTSERDEDQVVGRYCQAKGKVKKIFMVDQLWMWIMGPSLVITSFPQRWNQPKNDPLNVLDGIIEDINAKTGKPVENVHDLALVITARCAGSFDRHKPGDEDFQFLDMFESSIGNVNNQETNLYNQFYDASQVVHNWLRDNSYGRKENERTMSLIQHRYPRVVDRFLDIGEETRLLKEIKDIQDELIMISRVLNQQKSTLDPLCSAICDDLAALSYRHQAKNEVKRRVDEQKRLVDDDIQELDRMGKLAAGIESSLINLLDLKQKQSNAFEARFARDQAAGTVRQGQVILIFTVVTIVFLPVSFMAQFFTINISEYQRDRSNNLPLSYASKYIFGVGFGISVFLIMAVFSINPASALLRGLRFQEHRVKRKGSEVSMVKNERRQSVSGEAPLARMSRLSREEKRSMESDLSSVVHPRRLDLANLSTSPVSFRIRGGFQRDLERGGKV